MRVLTTLLAWAVLAGLGGCGQKGPLTLPSAAAPASGAASSAATR